MKKLLAVLLAIPTFANAGIVYDNGSPLAGSGTITSDLDSIASPQNELCAVPGGFCYQEAADDFLLASAATITGATWWGAYSPANQFDRVPDDFTLRILDEFFGLVVEIALGSVNRADTGLDTEPPGGATRDIFRYDAVFGAVTLNAGSYWLSIVNNTAGDGVTERWSWAGTSGVTGSPTVARTSILPFTDTSSGWSVADSGFGDFDLAFTLQVPEPGTFGLFLLGLAGFGLARGRRRRD